MNYKYAFIFVITFVMLFGATRLLKAKMQSWFSKQTSVHFKQRSLDFGTIPSKRAASAYFVFTYNGPNDFKIQRIDTRCGCTVTDWPQTIITPNRTDSILVQYDAEEEGFFLKEIYVFSNAETSPDLLSIKGTVDPTNQIND